MITDKSEKQGMKLPKIESVKPYLQRYYRSLLPYYEYYKPLLTATFGETIPRHICYICPLCLERIIIFSEKGPYTNASFNLDHFPPQSVGGKGKMLVCEKCNNMAGTEFEPDMIDALNLLSYHKKIANSSIEAKAVLRYKGGKELPGNYGIKLQINDQANNILDFGPKLDKYRYAISWLEYVKSNRSDWEITLSGNLPSEKKVCRSMAKAAYLYCFALWGYEFAFSPGASNLRKVIRGELEYPFKVGYAYLLDNEEDKFPAGVCFIESPQEARSLVVHIPMVLTETGYKCIAGFPVPNPTESGWEDLYKYPKNEIHASVRVFHPFDINQDIHGFSNAWMRIVNGSI
jgi:hypothetical protein